jgi:hypothetical protein
MSRFCQVHYTTVNMLIIKYENTIESLLYNRHTQIGS